VTTLDPINIHSVLEEENDSYVNKSFENKINDEKFTSLITTSYYDQKYEQYGKKMFSNA
jgi:hypothetical protein